MESPARRVTRAGLSAVYPGVMIIVWHWLVHTGGIDNGFRYGTWNWYNFWSGLAGSFLVALTVWFFGFYVHRTCHVWWCPRPARYDWADPRRGVVYKLCRHCHPLHDGSRLTRRNISNMAEGSQR